MRSSIVCAKDSKLLIIGSNGLIGRSVTQSISAQMPDSKVFDISYCRRLYPQVNAKLIEGKEIDGAQVIFCGGKGGFGLSEEEAELQLRDFSFLCDLLASQIGRAHV